jgi:hypothetical protein
MLLWSLTMSDPPMCSMKDLVDGTYTLDDVIDMTLVLQWRAKQIRDLQGKDTK